VLADGIFWFTVGRCYDTEEMIEFSGGVYAIALTRADSVVCGRLGKNTKTL